MRGQRAVLEQAVSEAAVTREVIVAEGATGAAAAGVSRLWPGGRLTIIADEGTMRAAGDGVAQSLREAGLALDPPLILRETPRVKPRAEAAREIAGELKARGSAPLAVGAGVVNDLTKYAAETAGVPYVCIATAASMDGYAASGAALLDGGFKRTLACAPPIAVIADLDVIAAAPARMAAWGYGDIAGKIVAGADWQLADALGEEAINPRPFALVQDNVRAWLSRPADIAAGDAAALGDLMTGLLVSGFAMQAHGNSRPASGCEHLISHVWEMERLTFEGEPAAHGACVGIGTVAILALYEWLLAQDISGTAVERALARETQLGAIETEIAAAFAEPHLADSARAEMAVKMGTPGARRRRLLHLARIWPDLRETLRATLMPATAMEAALAACGAAAHPHDLGVPLGKLAADYRRARLIRRRYTLLDLLDDLGWLDRAIAALFAQDGFWGRRSEPAKSRLAAS